VGLTTTSLCLQIHGAVLIVKAARDHVTLEWESNPVRLDGWMLLGPPGAHSSCLRVVAQVNDMISDSLIALVLSIESNPGAAKGRQQIIAHPAPRSPVFAAVVLFLSAPGFAAIGVSRCPHEHPAHAINPPAAASFASCAMPPVDASAAHGADGLIAGDADLLGVTETKGVLRPHPSDTVLLGRHPASADECCCRCRRMGMFDSTPCWRPVC